MARYYCTPLGKVLQTILPSPIRKEGRHKEQQFVRREGTRQELIEWIKKHQMRSPKQAAILEALLPIEKGMLLTELLEQTGSSRQAVDALVKKQCITLEKIVIDRSPLLHVEYIPSKPKTLTNEQETALKRIVATIDKKTFATHLLYGITGSGKTEIYLQAIAEARKQGKNVLVLVPEISLTVPTIETFYRRFGDGIAILHHRLSPGERFDEWQRIHQGKAPIVIGARSAIFAPVPDLGLIIVDEEHEASYKQSEQAPCYHARDVAVIRGQCNQATVVLGSATPSLESYTNAKKGKYLLSTLTHRVETAKLPEVVVVDMQKEYEKAGGFTHFSQPLLDGIEERWKKGEKVILFLNRRGYHTALICPTCQSSLRCQHCDIALTYHKKDHRVTCHVCGYTLSPPPKSCHECHSDTPLAFRGAGTEQIERALHAIFPSIRTLRIDADTTRHKGSHQKLLKEFSSGKADLLIGTQMIAKGLHFPEVTLAAILNSDASLHLPDFRSAETTFQLLTQVAGRAGRGFLPGKVLLQTSLPTHSTILQGAQQDYGAFYQTETESRKLFQFPPFYQLVKFLFSSKEARIAQDEANRVRTQLIATLPSSYQLYPVIPSGHAKIKDLYRFQFLLSSPNLSSFPEALKSSSTKSS